jgi:UDP-glucose 4-epimerase
MRIKDARQTFLGIWIRQVLEGGPFEVWEGTQKRDFTYVDDAVEALLLAVASEEAHGQVFNLGGEPAVTLTELAELLVAVNGGGKYLFKSIPPERKRIDIGDYYADHGLIRKKLGWQPRVALRDGLAKTVAYYRENLKHYL